MTQQKVLVIEDNAQNLYLITFLLEKNGFTVVGAADGPKGIHLACQEHPDLILLDIQLPLMNGYQVAKRLRQMDGVRTIPIVAVTSYAMLGDRQKALEAGCTGYMEKPINPVTFMDEIKTYLQSGRTENDGSAEG